MKKELLIPVILILVLGAYLMFKDDNQTHYQLPTPPGVAQDQINRLTLKGPNLDLTFTKDSDGWLLGSQAYPADGEALKEMLATLTDLKITALASEKGDLNRYDLAEDQAVTVTAWDKDKQLMAIVVGKPSVTGNHTFVMLDGDSRIFHAAGNLRARFTKTQDQFRDKQVLSFKRGNVTAFTVEINETRRSFTARPQEASGNDEQKQETASALAFDAADGKAVDEKAVSDLLSALSDLTCQSYPRAPVKEELEKRAPRCKITLENGQTLVLNLFDQGEKALGTTSETPYTFELASYTAEDIQSYAEKLTGTESEKDSAQE